MKHTLFIADLHLSENRPDITQCFFHFLDQKVTKNCDALYILGDFFEVWIGDDEHSNLQLDVARKLKAINDNGTPIYFIHGNRDFLLKSRYAKSAGMTLLPEQHVIDLYGESILIMHGDELCIDDVDYQKFRKTARSKWWQFIMLNLPLWLRKKIASSARNKSKESQKGKSNEIMDVVQSEVEKAMQQHQVNCLIHGHTHRPNTHHFSKNNIDNTRIVLGDWYEQGSYLVVNKGKKELMFEPL